MASGCGGGGLDTVAVDGTVTLDGTPLDHGTVRFVPADKDGIMAIGKIGEGGTFVLATKGSDGILEGEYKVSVQSQKFDETVPERDRELGIGGKESAIPEKYNDPNTSGLTETIDGARSVAIELSSN